MNRDFAALSELLPRIAEEGSDFETIPEDALIANLASAVGGYERAKVVVSIARRIFIALSLLDEGEIRRDKWRMASFPALLCARSLLSGLGSEGFKILESGFWEPSEYRVDAQRALLRTLERQRRNASPDCQPIRRVCVSWALIAVDGKFLLVRREDPDRHREGSRGEFVPPGGKVSSADVEGLDQVQRARLFSPWVEEIDPETLRSAFAQALSRELDEELDLGADCIAELTPVGDVIKYTALEGAKSAHALTDYWIQLFHISVTERGKTALLHALARHADRYSWFDAAELAAKQSANGERAFVDALLARHSKDVTEFLDPMRWEIRLGGQEPIVVDVDFPFSACGSIAIGQTGNERTIQLGLDRDEVTILGVLAALRRGDPVSPFVKGLCVVPGLGWLIVQDAMLLGSLKTLHEKLKRALPDRRILAFEGRAVRVNVQNPGLVHFASDAFSFDLHDVKRGTEYVLRLTRGAIESRIGTADAIDGEKAIPETLGSAIHELAAGRPQRAIDKRDSIKRLQREQLRTLLQEMGARLLIREVDGVPELTVAQRAHQ